MFFLWGTRVSRVWTIPPVRMYNKSNPDKTLWKVVRRNESKDKRESRQPLGYDGCGSRKVIFGQVSAALSMGTADEH